MAQGDLLYRAASAWKRLTAGTSGQYLKTQGAGADPVWDTPAGAGDVTHTGTLTAHQVILGNGSADVTALGSLGSSGQVLTSNGAGSDPSWQSNSSSALLAAVGYAAGSDSTLSTISSNTMTDMDATNVLVTFTAPASGNVLVDTSVLHDTNTAGDTYFGLRESTTTVATAFVNGLSTASVTIQCRVMFLVTGLTPSSSHTYKLAHRVTSGSTHAFTGPNYGQAVMIVWAAP